MTSTTPSLEPLYVIDTMALIWYLRNDAKLGAQAKTIFLAAEGHQTMLVISAISLAELYFANAKNKWFTDFAQVYKDLTSRPYLRFIPFDHVHVPDFAQDALIPEMHDRIIAGVARRLGAPLITSDPLIVGANVVRTLW
jgi:PIN domain nuclease of toxin-antitoxin system